MLVSDPKNRAQLSSNGFITFVYERLKKNKNRRKCTILLPKIATAAGLIPAFSNFLLEALLHITDSDTKEKCPWPERSVNILKVPGETGMR
jgi:hypothetical protein